MWSHCASHALALLEKISSGGETTLVPVSSERPATDDQRDYSSSFTWNSLHSPDVRIEELQEMLEKSGCCSKVQEELAILYKSSSDTMVLCCATAFDATMRNLAEAVNEEEVFVFRQIESATRERFEADLKRELEKLRSMFSREVGQAAHQCGSGNGWDADHLNNKDTKPMASQASGGFDDGVNFVLFTAFQRFEHLTKGERLALSARTGLSQKQVATWVSHLNNELKQSEATLIILRRFFRQFANQRQRRTRPNTASFVIRSRSESNELPAPSFDKCALHSIAKTNPPTAFLSSSSIGSGGSDLLSPKACHFTSIPPKSATSLVEPLTDFSPQFSRTPIASYDSDVSTLFHQIDSSDLSTSSLDSKWSQDTPESYYGLPLPPASDMQFSFELPPTEAIEHFDYSPDNSIWNAFDSSFSSSSSSADSYLDEYTFQPPMGAENANPLTCGLLTARQATFAESPSSFGSSPLSTPDVEMDMDADSVFGHISEFGVLTAPSDTGLAN